MRRGLGQWWAMLVALSPLIPGLAAVATVVIYLSPVGNEAVVHQLAWPVGLVMAGLTWVVTAAALIR